MNFDEWTEKVCSFRTCLIICQLMFLELSDVFLTYAAMSVDLDNHLESTALRLWTEV